MPMSTYEGIVKIDLIQLDEIIQLPEIAKVYVIATNEFILKLDKKAHAITITSSCETRRYKKV